MFGPFCSADENDEVTFKALQREPELQECAVFSVALSGTRGNVSWLAPSQEDERGFRMSSL